MQPDYFYTMCSFRNVSGAKNPTGSKIPAMHLKGGAVDKSKTENNLVVDARINLKFLMKQKGITQKLQ